MKLRGISTISFLQQTYKDWAPRFVERLIYLHTSYLSLPLWILSSTVNSNPCGEDVSNYILTSNILTGNELNLMSKPMDFVCDKRSQNTTILLTLQWCPLYIPPKMELRAVQWFAVKKQAFPKKKESSVLSIFETVGFLCFSLLKPTCCFPIFITGQCSTPRCSNVAHKTVVYH